MAWLPGLTRLDAWGGALLRELGWNALAAAVVALAVWAVLRAWRSASPRWRIALWTLVFLRLVMPADWSHPFSLRAGLDRLAVATPLAGVFPAATIDMGRAPGGDAPPGPIRRPSAPLFAPLASVVLVAWAAGALVVFARYRRRLAAFRREARAAPDVSTPAVRVLVAEWRERFGIRRPVRAVAIDGASPFTVGTLRPIVAIPRRFLRPDWESVLPAIVAHELAHVRRWDAAALGLQSLLRAVYFFNPAIWIADRHLNLARECVCDGMVLAHRTLTPFEYGRGLLAVLRDQAGGPCREVTAMSLSPGQWTARVANLGGDHRASRRDAVRAWVVSLVVVAFGFPTGATAPAATGASSPPSRPEAPRLAPAAAVAPARPQAGAIAWASPIPEGRLTSGYGERRSPVTGQVERHTGVDLAAPVGTHALAAADGAVGFPANPETGATKPGLVRVTHADGYVTYYSVVRDIAVTEGQTVKQGAPIGVVGTPEGGTGPHLHFVVMKDGLVVDPETLIRFQRAR